MYAKLACLSVFLTVLSGVAQESLAQNAQSTDISTVMTERLEKPWRVSEWRTFNTTEEDSCTEPDTYQFHSDLSLEIRQCTSGEWVTTNRTWVLMPESDGRTYMLIGDEKFDVRYRKVGPQHQLKLMSVLDDQLDIGEEIVLIIPE